MALKGNENIFKWISEYIQTHASFRQSFWKWWYNFLSKRYAHVSEWTCMNYGYLEEASSDMAFEETSKNLYDNVVKGVSLDKKDILEIGSGRGGGLHHLHMSQRPQSSIGLDLSEMNIKFSNQRFQENGLSYIEGSADSLPLADSSLDIIVNVESSHTYPDFAAFVKECHRVLKPGGHFCYTDFRSKVQLQKIVDQISAAGFFLTNEEDISPQVRLGLEADEGHRTKLIHSNVPWWLRSPVLQFAGVPGSKFYTDLSSGETIYISIQARK